MPTAYDHYREAMDHLNTAQAADAGSPTEHYHLAAAQVHATLHLAAANGANRPAARPVESVHIEQGEEISDQMGGQPTQVPTGCDPWCSPESPCDVHRAKDVDDEPTDCWRDGCVSDNHDGLGPHVDAEGREFR